MPSSIMYILYIFHVLVNIVLLHFETWFNHSTFYYDHEDTARHYKTFAFTVNTKDYNKITQKIEREPYFETNYSLLYTQ
jgi:hypothetical protein